MRQCIKYFMIVLLGVLLYDSVAQAAGISCTFIRNDEERCILSQAPTTAHKQDIRSISVSYTHLTTSRLYLYIWTMWTVRKYPVTRVSCYC